MMERERAQLLSRVAEGDADAVVALLVEYHPILLSKVAERLPRDVRSLIEPEDVLQKAYIAVFAALGAGGAPRTDTRAAEAHDPARNSPPTPHTEAPSGPHDPARNSPRTPHTDVPSAASSRPTFPSPAAFYSWLETLVLRDMREAIEGLHAAKRDARRVVHGGGRDSMVAALQTLATVTDSTPSRAMARDEAAGLLLISLARLTEDQRRVVQLRFFDSEPVRAVALSLGKTEEAVHALTYRALRELRGMMDGALRSRS